MMIYGIWFLLIFFNLSPADSISIAISKDAASSEKMPLLLVTQSKDPVTEQLIYLLKEMLSCNHFSCLGFAVTVNVLGQDFTKTVLKDFYEQGFSLALLIKKKELHILWSLFDTKTGEVLAAKESLIPQFPIEYFAEHIADQVWTELTGKKGFFSTRIAACKDIGKGKKALTLLAPYPSFAPKTPSSDVLCTGKILAPRWNVDPKMPLVFYSTITDYNISLKSISLNKKESTISNFVGINYLPSFSPSGHKVAFCLSCQGKSNVYLYEVREQKTLLKRITLNNGNNVSPILLASGDVIFCSDFQTGSPRLYYWQSESGKIETLTPDSSATCPAYHEPSKKLVYSRFINGAMQLFVCDMITKKHTQITFDASNKQEPTWAPCGTLLAYAQEMGKQRTIAIMHYPTRQTYIATNRNEKWSYPAWSGHYESPLMLMSSN